MEKMAKLIEKTTGLCMVGEGNDTLYYVSIGMELMDVEQSYEGVWYLTGYAPDKPAPTKEEQSSSREAAYQQIVDPITCHISRLIDEEQTEEVKTEIEALKAERAEKVAAIKAAYPYPETAA